MTELQASRAWWARASAVIPMGTQTLSKGPNQFVQGVSSIFIERGRGAHVWDVDGNELVDFPMALGPIILGHAEPAVDEAIARQLRDGITFTLMHPLEVEVAELIVAMVPGVEAVRFAKSGSDALAAAVRACRAITGRDLVLAGGYHGWHDWFIGTTSRHGGVPSAVRELTSTFPFNDPAALEAALEAGHGEVAAVVVEPSAATPPAAGYLEALVTSAHRHGALVVFDEVITGFRLGRGGARERYGVEPDLSCYGKALGNGMPIAAVAGRWSVMRIFEEIFFSGTHGGEALSLAAARAVLDALADGKVLDGINQRGRALRAALEAQLLRVGTDRVAVDGEPERTVITFPGDDDRVTKSFVQQCFAEDGILFNGSMFICHRHDDEDISRAVKSFGRALDAVSSGEDLRPLLAGEPVAAVFRAP